MENTRKLVNSLHLLIATEMEIVFCTQIAHWNVNGTEFYSLHKMLGDQYEEFFEEIDKIAEIIRTLNYEVSKQKILKCKIMHHEKMKKMFHNWNESRETNENREMLKNLVECHKCALDCINYSLMLCNFDSSNFESEKNYLGELQGRHKKAIWFLKSSLTS
jgi:starvation-inducible DNA-binding protein